MGQYCFARWRLSSSSVTLLAGGPAAAVAGRHRTAGQYGYVPLGRTKWQAYVACNFNSRL